MAATDIVLPDREEKEKYMVAWCRQTEDVWSDCKRYITKKELSFCPDFVLPDTLLSIKQIIEKFDEQSLT